MTASLRSQLQHIITLLTHSCFSPQSLEELTERCESALTLLGDALRSMDTEPLPDCIKVPQHLQIAVCLSSLVVTLRLRLQNVALSADKHRQLMTSILTDQRLTQLQQRGGTWLAGLANGMSGLAQKSPDCKYDTDR